MKRLWNKLAQKNSKYYINTDYGKGITDDEFRKSGLDDYKRLVMDDELLIPGGVFLEIGCGTGRMTEFIAKDYQVIPVDISGEMVRLGKQRLPDINFVENDGYTFPIKDSTVDIAFSYLVFQHMKERKMVESNLRDVYRVLKSGGIFKVRVRIDKVTLSRWWGGVGYGKEEITKICEQIGYRVIKTEPVEHYGLWLWLRKD